MIESLASKNFKLGDRSHWRKATILADAMLKIVLEDDDFSGNMLIDDVYLRQRHGFTDDDLAQYRCAPDVAPPRLLALEGVDWGADFRRGDVKKLERDVGRSSKL